MTWRCCWALASSTAAAVAAAPADIRSLDWTFWTGYMATSDASSSSTAATAMNGRLDRVQMMLRVDGRQVMGVARNQRWGRFSVSGELLRAHGRVHLTFVRFCKRDRRHVHQFHATWIERLDNGGVDGVVGWRRSAAHRSSGDAGDQPALVLIRRRNSASLDEVECAAGDGDQVDWTSPGWQTSGAVSQKLVFQVFSASSCSTCIVCFDGVVDTVLLPCGHAFLCHRCASTLSLCPLCRADISKAHRRPDANALQTLVLPLRLVLSG